MPVRPTACRSCRPRLPPSASARRPGRGRNIGPTASPMTLNRVVRLAHLGQRRADLDQRRRHMQFKPRFVQLRHGDQLDPIAEFLGIPRSAGSSVSMPTHGISLQWTRAPNARCARIASFCAASPPRRPSSDRARHSPAAALRPPRRRTSSLLLHLRDDEVRRAVQDAAEAVNLVGREALRDVRDDRDAAGHAGIEGDRPPQLAGPVEQLRPVLGQQQLVGGDDVLAAFQQLGA
jgi:hypothetical protein